ncbi:WD40-repeat-containing domain protein [Rhypophila decipiens]|uniref:WD40-repeat-containing domain protein n=1 Tax=Rhypophila decipiens TaxID=261697 RepID=A0AAN6YHA3_9PEZI|nr:WD40-repeat-containing domain protein [Rhypophila decipiens]
MMHPSRQAYMEEAEPEDNGGIDIDSIPIDRDYVIPDAGTGASTSALLSHFERRRLAATIAVPTDDTRVRAKLRELGEPVTLFGEDLADRRGRLRELLAEKAEQATPENADVDMIDADKQDAEDQEQEEEFYTGGSEELLQARINIAHYSLPRAKKRIEFQKKEATIPLRTHIRFRKEVKERLQDFELQGSQPDDRKISITRISPNGQMVATGNWGGQVKLIQIPTLRHQRTFRGHTNIVSGISWRPGATLPEHDISPDTVNLATGGAEGQVNLWSLTQDTPLSTLSGHSERVCRVEFHPSGKYLASASEDTSWRLWDIETTTELLLQEGHSRGVYAVAFNTDGSLLASAGLDSIGRIWDLRSGRTIMILDGHLDGHIKPIYGLDWGSDGHRVLSASADGWIKCWDVRKVQRSGGIGAHTSSVSDVRWFKGLDDPLFGTPPGDDEKGMQLPKKSSTFLVSSGFDEKVNIFSADDWSLVQSLSAHTGPVASVDVSRDGKYRPPPREGYQPPSLPPKPPPPIGDRLSKSPTRRRDVLPAVPSPPTHSSRTSPPRPLSRRSATSPAPSSPQRLPQARPDQWLFTPDEVASTPSIIHGLSLAEERLRRSKGINFIYQAGIMLNLPQLTLWVAGVFFHRFYMRYSMVEDKGGIHHYNIAATALFLANKTEENTRKTKDLIIAVAKVAQKNAKLIIDEQSKEYWRWRDSILTYEELMLEMLTFDLMIDIPHNFLYEQLGQLAKVHDKPLRESAWAFCNDACLTVLPLLINAREISISAIFFATSVTHDKIADINGEPWWRFLKGNEEHIIRAIEVMTEFYKENPLRKQDKIPGSPEFSLESTRRRGETITSQTEGDYNYNGTPLGTDRGGTQSPRSRTNGKAQYDDGAIKKEESGSGNATSAAVPGIIKTEDSDTKMVDVSVRGDSDAALKVAANDMSTHDHGTNGNENGGGGGLRSPLLPPPISGVKRRSVEVEDEAERERELAERKRPRVNNDDDQDEGEINGS